MVYCAATGSQYPVSSLREVVPGSGSDSGPVSHATCHMPHAACWARGGCYNVKCYVIYIIYMICDIYDMQCDMFLTGLQAPPEVHPAPASVTPQAAPPYLAPPPLRLAGRLCSPSNALQFHGLARSAHPRTLQFHAPCLPYVHLEGVLKHVGARSLAYICAGRPWFGSLFWVPIFFRVC
jgi:hypothetical protein